MVFVDKFNLWTPEQISATEEIARKLENEELRSLRFCFPDQHGALRGKTLLTDAAQSGLSNGVAITSTLLAKDTSHKTVFPIFTAGGGFGLKAMQGAADIVMVAVP